MNNIQKTLLFVIVILTFVYLLNKTQSNSSNDDMSNNSLMTELVKIQNRLKKADKYDIICKKSGDTNIIEECCYGGEEMDDNENYQFKCNTYTI